MLKLSFNYYLGRAKLFIIFSLAFAIPSFASSSPTHQAATATVAVAANFSHAAKQLKTQFEKTTPHSLTLSFSSSGRLYAQIRHGAPYDIFLSADQEKPKRLINEQLGIAETYRIYAVGRLALWAPPYDLTQTTPTLFTPPRQLKAINPIDTPDVLLALKSNKQDSKISNIAMANGQLAPYGLAAKQVLQSLNIQIPKKHLIRGENINQAYQFVHSGNAAMGFVALSQLMAADLKLNKHIWLVPQTLHQPIAQGAILLKYGQNNSAAKAFLDYLQTLEAQAIIRNFGYDL